MELFHCGRLQRPGTVLPSFHLTSNTLFVRLHVILFPTCVNTAELYLIRRRGR